MIISAILVAIVLLSLVEWPKPPRPAAPKLPTPPPKTQWEKKKESGGVHTWICNNQIDPDYIDSLPDYEDGGTMEPVVKDEKPF